MTTKSATANGVSEEKHQAVIDGYLQEMTIIRKRMKPTESRIRRADIAIRQSLDEAWAILRHVQAGR